MKRTDIINSLISKFGYKSYLEIGTQFPENNYNLINAKQKDCVEPFPPTGREHIITFAGTSDEYFASIPNEKKFDIIFIDGLHHSDQVIKDILNSVKHLNDNGTIVCHDCLPYTEKMQLREDNGGEWTGDVWKAIAELRVESIDLDIRVVDTDYGCGIIRRGTNIPYETMDNYKSYYHYSMNKWRMLNVISPEQFIQWINTQS